MTTKPRNKTSKLGHDPLAWMGSQGVLDETIESACPAENSVVDDIGVEQSEAPVNQDLTGAGACVVTLPEHFGIAQVGEMLESMKLQLSADVAVIELHGDKVESIDAAAVQLLISFFIEARGAGRKIDFTRHSEKIGNIADLLNLRQSLSLE